ncbi:MAG: Wzy polymerase domain-containing protein [Pseudomonadota bacterium]
MTLQFPSSSRIISPFWMAFSALSLSLAWLLPNHSQPWLSFHSDAWAALMLLLVGGFVLVKARFAVSWNALSMLTALVCLVPLLQYATGQVALFGVAWINFAYLLGFLVALLAGSAWEARSPRQCGDYLFLAIMVAAAVSVGLQLTQFFQLQGFGPWILPPRGYRHFANMAQPNQLASLLILAVLGCGWQFHFRRLPGAVAFVLAAWLLLGVALTESRTAWLNFSMIVLAVLIWRAKMPSRAFVLCVLALGVFYALCVLALPYANHAVGGAEQTARSTSGDARWLAWKMFLEAVLSRPWAGFGWGQLGHAQFLMLDEKVLSGANFLQSHNLILDLLLWNGVVLGSTIVLVLAFCCVQMVRRIREFPELVQALFAAVLGLHAMLEFPLQYAYFLLPFGLVLGALGQGGVTRRVHASAGARALTGAAYLAAAAVLAVTISDYFKVESSLYGLRFQQQKIKSSFPVTPPDVLVLDQWRQYLELARLEPRPGIPPEKIQAIRQLVSTVPSAFGMSQLAAVLAMNGNPAEAALWLRRLCVVTPAQHCLIIKQQWREKVDQNEAYARVPWPVD